MTTTAQPHSPVTNPAASLAASPAENPAENLATQKPASTKRLRFGQQLKHWRRSRQRSQLDLSLHAGISQRHLSFLECGHSSPSRQMVMQLAEALELPLIERNAMLSAAGYAPLYQERSLTGPDIEPEMQPIQKALQMALDHHAPFPAMVVDRAWNLLMANDALFSLFGSIDGFLEEAMAISGSETINLMKLSFHPNGLRRFTLNWEAVALDLLNRVRRDARETNSAELWALIDELLSYDEIPTQWHTPDWETAPEPVLSSELQLGPQRLKFFSMIASFGTPQDITTDNLRLELMFPADDSSNQYFRKR